MRGKLIHGEITREIRLAAYDVHNTLGFGFLEKVYENALALELSERGHQVEQQVRINVIYKGRVIGDYVADLLVDQKVIVELKTGKTLSPENEAQLLNYLRATTIEVGLMINFGKDVTIERRVMSNENKAHKHWRS